MIKIKNGKITFGEKVLLEDINLEIPKGKLTIILGPNGAGKTSLINILAGVKKLSIGTIINNFHKSILIPQRIDFPQGITLFDYLSSVFYQSGWKWNISEDENNQILQVIEKLDLTDKKDASIDVLSAGELQLANIALCLLSGADFIMLDEPSANLDMLNQIKILEVIKKLTTNGITVVAIMHDINFAAKYGDNFLIVEREGVINCGDKCTVLTPYNLSKAYNFDFKVVEFEDCLYIHPDC